MFVVSTNKKKIFREGSVIGLDKSKNQIYFTWDHLPTNIRISSLQLTYPFKVKLENKKGIPVRSYAPNLTIGNFDRYYFSNEATQKIMISDNKQIPIGSAQLEAKIIAGIDDHLKFVLEIRMDKSGNSSINKFPLSDLEARIKNGTFREDIIRKG